MISPLITGYLLGKHVELRLKNGDIERGVVVGLALTPGQRELRLTHEKPEDYRPDLGVWIVRHPREEWTRKHEAIEGILVVDFAETKSPDKKDEKK